MATLEKIRSKQVLLFTIIIVALLAFILGDFLTSGRTFFGTGDTVASANGVKVDYNTYRLRLSENSEADKNQGRNTDNDVLSQNTIDELLVEALLNKEYDKMGITVTDKQLKELMLGDQFAPQTYAALMQQFGGYAPLLQQKGVVDAANFYRAMKKPASYGISNEEAQMMTSMWTKLEKDYDEGIRSQAYGALIQGLFAANKIDAKEMYDGRNVTAHVAFAAKPLSAVADKDVKVTDEDIKKVYDEHKGSFRLDEETRAITFITVPIIPSDADYAKAQKEVESLIADLNEKPGTEGLAQHPEFNSNTASYTKSTMARVPQLRPLLVDSLGIQAGAVRVLNMTGTNYLVAKVLDVTSGVDNIKFSVIAKPKAEADTIVKTLTVANFDSIARAQTGAVDITTSLVTPTVRLNEKQIDALAHNAVGQIFTITDTITAQDAEGKPQKEIDTYAFLIKERDAAVPVYEISLMEYVVAPSTETINDLTTKFHAYVGNNADTKTFTDNAEKSGYTAIDGIVSASTPSINNLPNSRGAIKWAMENGKNKVSPVFNMRGANGGNEYLLAVAVDEIYDGEYLPVTAKPIQDNLKEQAMRNKKAEKLIAQYNGKAKDVAGYAAAMGVTPGEADVVFADDNIMQIGYGEGAVQGKVAAAKKGQVVGPFQGNNAVYVISVVNTNADGRPFNLEENQQAFAQKYNRALLSNPLKLLVGNKKVKNNILTFTAEEVN